MSSPAVPPRLVALDPQALRVGGAAPEAARVRAEPALEAGLGHPRSLGRAPPEACPGGVPGAGRASRMPGCARSSRTSGSSTALSAEPRDGLDVVVDGERIAAVVPHGTLPAPLPGEPPPTIIAGRGRTLLPGLIDAHAHYTFDPTEGSIATIAGRSDAEIVLAAAGHAARALRAGTTTARGAGSIRNLELVLRDAIAAGRVPGPRLVAAGAAIGITGGHGHQFGIEADGEGELIGAVRRQIRAGADVIKIVASEAAMLTTTGLAPGRIVHGDPELTESEIRAIVSEAHRQHLRVMSHAQGPESVSRVGPRGRRQRRARLAGRPRGHRSRRRVRRVPRPDPDRDRRQPRSPRPDAGPARAPGPHRAAPSGVVRGRHRARRPARHGDRHRRGRGHLGHGLARDRAAARPRR